ncbi:hypothetical protein T265_03453 [Opisthorchis viverrini]|uniref:Poly [ADP-ribose] polymerase n=1 Tax=Opisthorchis viverrini TaxID=6198 RepID=A0A074ZSJ5_OPIVI|nr:hypothetical protein T265_03453 [Opisthorchis viverrini]KER30091.1 hypothetical protein T265_03453 [Opisthorchis viverrini]
MPPKRKVTSAVKTSVKQAKTDDDTDEKLTLKKKLSALKKVEDKKTHKVDKNFCVAGDCLPSLLDEATQGFVRRIFSAETFEHAMRALNLDLKKMPLGKLSAKQIANAYEILDELEGVIEGKKKGDVTFLSSRFYTIMPHDFGRTRPPLIDTKEQLASKFDMLNTLSDVALAQAMQKEGVKGNQKKKHWIDEKYSLLDCDLDYLNASDVNRRLVEEYFTETGRDWFEIVHVWRVNRQREGDRFRPYLKTGNHKLLWHGTNVAVVAAILKSGLRIMPHSGGLVGKGIYFASAADKSQDYGWADSDGYRIMFLAEVALGKEHPIFHSDSSIRKAPDGFDSVVAQGKFEPDPKFGKVLQLDGVPVNVLCSKPVQRDIDSWFYYSEYLIYNESQCRLRFVILYRPKK